MKIVIDARTLGSKPSGIGIYAYHFLCGLLSDYEVILVTDVATSSEMQELRKKNVRIIEYGKVVYRSTAVFSYFRFVRKILREIQPELFWEPNILIPIPLTGFSGKSIITIHDMFPVTMPQYFGWKYSHYFRYMLKKTIRRTDMILYNSEETKKDAEAFDAKAAAVENHVLYIIVPEVHYDGPIRDDNYFLYVGNVEKRKGVDILIRAFDRYVQAGGTKNLVIAGKKREQDVDDMLSDLVKKYPDRVTYKGYVTDAEKNDLYARSSAVLFQSRAEGFGICALEAMSFKKPVLASDLSIFSETVGDAIRYFPLSGGEAALCDAMLKMTFDIEEEKYKAAMMRFYPETLIPRLKEILDRAGKK